MADDSKQTGSGFGGNAFLWLALLTAGSTFLLSREAPFKDSRPPPAVAVTDQQADRPQNIDSRLWQDPFSAVERSQQDKKIVVELTPFAGSGSSQAKVLLEAHQHLAPCSGNDCRPFAALKQELADPNLPMLVLGVMLSRASYSDDAEFRRRVRYAVLAALNVEGYKPDDPAHIGALSLPSDLLSSSLVPFELLSIVEKQAEKKPAAKAPKKILVLRLDEDAFFAKNPLQRLARIADAAALLSSQAKFKILGPEYSDTLRAILDEHDRRCKPSGDGCKLDFYLYSSTIDVEKDRDIPTVHRVIATDNVLAEQLVEELKRRELDPSITTIDARGRVHHKHHVAIVGEWDIGYGEAQPELFAEAVGGGDRTWLHSFSYLRGLDGEQAVSAEDKSQSNDRQNSEKTPNVRPGPAQLERAEGEGQFDYLRRLSDRIKRTDAKLREQGDQIAAIGVLGTDLYDKLLILQALRPRFPDALFFTTDYDERLLHPAELGWTRNLIVASSYGTQLREEVQRDIPPFRNNYQTAAFLAARYAVHSSTTDETTEFDKLLHRELGTARLAEIGLAGVQWLPTRPEKRRESDDADERAACNEELFQCKYLQPEPDRLLPLPL